MARTPLMLKRIFRKAFEIGQHLGFDILPRHFYSEIPDIRVLRKETQWKRPFSMAGVNGAEAASQLTLLKACCSALVVETLEKRNIHHEAAERNGEDGFGAMESDLLFAFVATKKPKQIFQIGCGVSTAVCLFAAEFAGYEPEIICVEPFPNSFLLKAAEAGKIRLIGQKAQALDLGEIERLDSNVLFFVDSTHTLGPAGECSRIILEMLPRLKTGAYAHFHDVVFPYDYGRDILSSALFFWHESVLLHAFLAYNSRFRILCSMSMLHHAAASEMASYLPNYIPDENDDGIPKGKGHFPSSIYLEVVG